MGCNSSSATAAHETLASSEPAAQPKKAKPSGGSTTKKSEPLTVNDYYKTVKKELSEGKAESELLDSPQFIAFARYLGLDPNQDGELLWIAAEALKAPVPEDWSEHSDSGDRMFYYNCKTKASSWIHPLETLHRETYRAAIDFRHTLDAGQRPEELKRLKLKYEEDLADSALKSLDWSEHVTDRGQRFFFNKVSRISSWNDPRLAKAHELNLQRRTINFLQGETKPDGDNDSLKETMSGMKLGQGPATVTERPALPEAAPKEASLGLESLQCKGKEWLSLLQLMRVTDPENLGIGRDVRAAKGSYNRLTPVKAWRIQRPHHWKIFDATRSMVAEDLETLRAKGIRVPKVESKLELAARWLGGMDEKSNEQILLHGTKPENLLTIIHGGLSERVSGGLLGQGVYLGEDPSKIDQYCTPDVGRDNAALAHLHAELYPGEEHPGEVYYAIVCRAVLGMPVFTKNGKTNLKNPGEAIFRASDRRELALIPESAPPIGYHSLIAEAGPADGGYILQRHRELVMFNCNRVVEQYVIAYKRDWNDEPLVEAPSELQVEWNEPEPVSQQPQTQTVQIGDIDVDLESVEGCYNCLAAPSTAPKEKLRELKAMREEGLITDQEFQSKKQMILQAF